MKKDELISKWQSLIEEVIELCLRVSLVVAPIVSSNSPEGIFPMELVQRKLYAKNSKIILLNFQNFSPSAKRERR
jgi:hypothetical protein